jgi:hypothetical protein
METDTTYLTPLPPLRPDDPVKVALISMWLGSLPTFTDYFLKSIATSASDSMSQDEPH